MNTSQSAVLRQSVQLAKLAQRPALFPRHQWARHSSSSSRRSTPRRGGKALGFGIVFAAAAAGAYYYPRLKTQFSQPAQETTTTTTRPKAQLEFEKPRGAADSKEDHRDILSSQHLQVKGSWEHPGVYVWGSNAGKVIDPTSNDKYVKLPRRLAYFNDQVLRDLKLSREFGAAVTENGDLVQWGLGFSKTNPAPSTTLKGKDLVKLAISDDRIIALSRKGSVYSIPTSNDDQLDGSKQERQASSWSLWSSAGKENINFRDLTPTNLGMGEKVTDISSGLEHCLILTSKGRVFSSASSTSAFPSKGQMGIPGLTWETRPAGAYDQAHEIRELQGVQVEKISTGDYHSVILDKAGRIFSFGDNTFGQLGFEGEARTLQVRTPTVVAVNKLYPGGVVAKITSVAAGGNNTFFTVDAEAPLSRDDDSPAKGLPRVSSDLWAAGQGQSGTLGTGRWTHISQGPTKVKALSSLVEFDEKRNRMVPIRLKSLSIGSTHCSAVMGNATHTSASGRSSQNETNWGSDVLFWGGNEFYQLGTGKRSNLNAPTYIGPLDGGEADASKGRKGEVHRLCLTPRQTARLGEGGKGRKVTLEQRVECGRFVTGVYSAV